MNPETINYNSAEKRNIMATFAARGGHLAGNYGVTLYNCPSKLRATAFVKPVNFIISNSAFLNGRPSASAFQAQDIKGQNASKFLQELTPQGSQHYSRPRIFSGTANLPLAQEIACYMGLELGKIKIKRFADGEIYVQLQESVRGCDVFLVQPTCPPANENLMELLVMIDACRRASARI